MAQDILGALGFYVGAPVEDLRRIFCNVIMPTIDLGWKNDDAANQALFLETMVYEILVKSEETEASFTYAYDMMQHSLNEAGIRALGITPRTWARLGRRPRVAFWLPGTAILAHTQQLIILLQGLKEMGDQAPITPLVYVGAPTSKELRDVVLAAGADIRFLGDNPSGRHVPPLELLRRAAGAVSKDGVQALVFVSTPVHLVTAVAMRIAPTIIWWSMKWYALDVDVDERMTPRRGTTLKIAGRDWRCGHVCLPVLVDDSRKDDMRRRTRDRYKIPEGSVAIGWMGREEKLTVQYGEAIATLLETNRTAIFLYTGRRRIEEFEACFKQVADRVRYIGWVDVATTIWAFDVYADCFPMGSGHTAFAAMQAGIPVITLMTEENEKNSAAAHIQQLWKNLGNELTDDEHQDAIDILGSEDEFGFVPFEYYQPDWHYRLCELIQDAETRRETGLAQQKFVHRFLMDRRRYAEQTGRIILETISRKTGIPMERLAPTPAPQVEHGGTEEADTSSPIADGAGPGEGLAGQDGGPAAGRTGETAES